MDEAINFSALIQSISIKLFPSASSIHLDSTNLLQELRKGVLDSLQVGVTTDVLLLDINVGNSALTRDLLKSILDGGTILYTKGKKQLAKPFISEIFAIHLIASQTTRGLEVSRDSDLDPQYSHRRPSPTPRGANSDEKGSDIHLPLHICIHGTYQFDPVQR